MAVAEELHYHPDIVSDGEEESWATGYLSDPLHDDEEALLDEWEALQSDTIEPLTHDGPGASASSSTGTRSAWFQVRQMLVHEGEDPATEMTVLQAAFNHVEAVHRGSTIAQVEVDIKRALARYAPSCGAPAPNNPKCRYPPSYYLCKVVCDMSDLAEAEVHLCSNDNCPHMTVFPWMCRPALLQHLQSCTDSACRRCNCPCGGTRMTRPSPGCTPQPQAPCYFFKDVFQQFFLDSEWYEVAAAAHRQRQGNFYSNPEGLRILDEFGRAGVSSDEVRDVH